MFIVAPAFNIRSIKWTLDRPAQANVSGWTGRRTVTANPWHGKWRAEVELAPLVGEANVRALRSFLARCRGRLNTFRLYATEGKQNDNVDVTSEGNAAAATYMTLANLSTQMSAGQMVTVKGQLLMLTKCGVLASGGRQGVDFEPPLRQAVEAGAPVVTAGPYALVHLAEATTGWSVEPGAIYGMAFNVEEAILEADGTAPESQLVINGYFTTDTAGWTPSSLAGLSVVSGRLRVTNNGTGAALAYQAIATDIGQTYRVKADLFVGDSPAVSLFVGTTIGGAELVSLSGAGSKDTTFVATAATIYINLRNGGTSIAGQYNDFDNISMRVA